MAKLEPHPLMRTIVDHPDLDAPRLVYADWLDEQGDPKLSLLAEYIRLGVELATVPKESEQWNTIWARMSEMSREDWRAVRPPMPKWAIRSIHHRRGLPYWLECSVKRFAEGGARVLEYAPITDVSLNCGGQNDAEGTRFASSALLRKELIRVRKLDVGAPLTTESLESLALRAAVGTLRRLSLWFPGSPLPNEGATALAGGADRFTSLAELEISANPISARARRILQRAFGERLRFGTAA